MNSRITAQAGRSLQRPTCRRPVEIIALLGYYGLTAMTQRIFNMEPPE